MGSALYALRSMQDLARRLECAIVSVDYRLAPETRFAGSLEDNYAALRWLHANAAELGVDPTRIGVLGESAGGCHATLLAITARDRGEIRLALQMLIYPMLDDRTGSTRSVPAHIGRILWTAESNRFCWAAFLGCEPGGRNVPAGAVPARVENLAGLPPTFVGVGALDLFVREDIDYARRLINAGVPTELVVMPGAFHGFDAAESAQVTRQFDEIKMAALQRWLGASASQ
jgi:acetyl esterase/lipase